MRRLSLSEIIEISLDNPDNSSASDIHLVYGLPPRVRRDGRLLDMQNVAPLDDDDCIEYACELAGEDRVRALRGVGEIDLAKSIAGVRIRGNVFWQQGHLSTSLRLLKNTIPRLETLGLPAVVASLPSLRRGIVLVTGITGSGKSTTLAAMLQRVNETRPDHIITLEDPIEYIYTPDKCVVNQREIGADTESYATGLKAILREDPDVILIGELRDNESIQIALTAAETGHLVFGTLHTASAADTIDRIVESFPPEKQRQIRMQLSQTLMAVLSQQLLPLSGGVGRTCACEIMVVNHAMRNLIREGKTPQIQNAILTSADNGSVTMDNTLRRLLASGLISVDVAMSASRDPEEFATLIGKKR